MGIEDKRIFGIKLLGQILACTVNESDLIIRANMPVIEVAENKMPILVLNSSKAYLENIKKDYNRYQALLSITNIEDIWFIDKSEIDSLLKDIEGNVPIVYETMSNMPTEYFKEIKPLDNILCLTYLICAYTIGIMKDSGLPEVTPDTIIETMRLNNYFLSFERHSIVNNPTDI